MRKYKKILIWTTIAVVLQQVVFLYIEKIYLKPDKELNVKEVTDRGSKEGKLEVSIRESIDGIKVSSTGRYIAYLDNNKIKVLDSTEDIEKEVESMGEVVFYKWLSNEDSILIVQKIKEKNGYYFEPISFSAKKGEVRELSDFDMKDVRIKLENKWDKIDSAVFSNITHSLYIKVKKSSGKSDLYYSNIMNQIEKVRSNKNIGDMVVPATSSKLVMELDSKITILDSSGNILIPNTKKAAILGSDINDNVYFGEIVEGKVKRILYCVLSESERKWNELKLSEPVDKEDIQVDYSGKVYVNYKKDNKVVELISDKRINYEGEFVQGYSKGIVSTNGNKLIKTPID
ncbi:hypothetical protein ACQPU1_01675 [Clostridium paraputrificum]|uniref:hypothetical protein n=1 Tax=Clostridium paraputrificum TaxID=29363 RepID=UPI003D35896D